MRFFTVEAIPGYDVTIFLKWGQGRWEAKQVRVAGRTPADHVTGTILRQIPVDRLVRAHLAEVAELPAEFDPFALEADCDAYD